jgi:predicted DNA binding CopG/RHH family protein
MPRPKTTSKTTEQRTVTVSVRLPADLHRELRHRLLDHGLSFQAFILQAVREYLGRTREARSK